MNKIIALLSLTAATPTLAHPGTHFHVHPHGAWTTLAVMVAALAVVRLIAWMKQ
jgi:hypothetical protein